jgi:hypothetical protein
MVGTWNYSSPAVCFKSDNLLKKAGGSAVASTIENKLAPYYKKSGIEKLVLTISSDGSFTMKFGKGSVSGTITEGSDGIMTFKFKALSKYNITSMNAYVTMSGTSAMSLTFDVSKLSSLVKMAGSVSGNSTIQSVSSLLDSYDGICAGFKLTKQ